jgi:hypothetical protein
MRRAPLFVKATVYSIVAAAAFCANAGSAFAQLRYERELEPERDQPSRRSDRRSGTDWLLSLEGVTNAPVDVGGRVTLETPFRLRLATGLGVIPGAYLGLVNDAVASMGAYDDRTAGIIDGSFDGGSVWRSQVGFRPFPSAGFYVDAGYALVNLSGSVYGSDVSAPDVVVDGTSVRDAGYAVHTTVHMWLVEMGWNAQIRQRLILGAALGVMGTFSSHTDAEPNFRQGNTAVARSLSSEATQTIDETLERYGYVPTLTLRIGYDFL